MQTDFELLQHEHKTKILITVQDGARHVPLMRGLGRLIMELKLWPWENDIEPYFVNDGGYEWYLDEGTTKYARKDDSNGNSGLENVYAFIVADENKDDITFVLIDNKQNVLHEDRSLEGIGSKIDIMNFAQSA